MAEFPERLLADFPEPSAVLIVYSLSRLARSQRVLWNILDDRGGLGIRVVSVTEQFETLTPAGRAMIGMLAVWSALEADMIAERTSSALQHLKSRGIRLGNPRFYESRINGSIIVDPRKLQVCRYIQQLARSKPGISQREIAAFLNFHSVRSVTGKRWWQKTIGDILKTRLPDIPDSELSRTDLILPAIPA